MLLEERRIFLPYHMLRPLCPLQISSRLKKPSLLYQTVKYLKSTTPHSLSKMIRERKFNPPPRDHSENKPLFLFPLTSLKTLWKILTFTPSKSIYFWKISNQHYMQNLSAYVLVVFLLSQIMSLTWVTFQSWKSTSNQWKVSMPTMYLFLTSHNQNPIWKSWASHIYDLMETKSLVTMSLTSWAILNYLKTSPWPPNPELSKLPPSLIWPSSGLTFGTLKAVPRQNFLLTTLSI